MQTEKYYSMSPLTKILWPIVNYPKNKNLNEKQYLNLIY